MTKQQRALAYIAARLADAEAANAADRQEASTPEERAFADGQRLTLNQVAGWVMMAFPSSYIS